MTIKDIGFLAIGFLLGAVGICTVNKQKQDICTWEETSFYTIDTVTKIEYVYINKKPKTKTVVNDTTVYTYKDSINRVTVFDTIKILDGEIIDFKQNLEISKDSLILQSIVNQYFPRSLNIAIGLAVNDKLQYKPSIAVRHKRNQFSLSYNPITHEKSINYHRWLFKTSKKRPKISILSNTR